MASDDERAEIVNNEAAGQYEAHLGDIVARAVYLREGNRITFTHTDVPPEARGHGLASQLAEAALRDAREQGLEVVPICPYFVSYIRRHQEYLPLVVPERRESLRRGAGNTSSGNASEDNAGEPA